jgi:hypothetical protein
MSAATLSSPQPSTINHKPPTTRGWIQTTYRNYKGKKLGPYYVRRWKVGKTLHREYVNAKDLERIQAECDAHREKRKREQGVSRWITNTWRNLEYLQLIAKWSAQGKLRPVDVAFFKRIQQEGYDIDGRPPIKRRVTRHIAKIAGQRMLVKTVFELDGSSQVFVAPLLVKDPIAEKKALLERIMKIGRDAWEAAHAANPNAFMGAQSA